MIKIYCLKKFLRKQKVGRGLFQTLVTMLCQLCRSCSSSKMQRKPQHTQQCASHEGHSATRTATQQPSTRQASNATVMMNSILRIVHIQRPKSNTEHICISSQNSQPGKESCVVLKQEKKIIKILIKCKRCTLSPHSLGCWPLSRTWEGRVLTLQVQIAPLSPAAGVFQKPQHSQAPCRVHPKSHLGRGWAGWQEACWCR